jgi:molybdenum cofactor cytidylyltransferase
VSAQQRHFEKTSGGVWHPEEVPVFVMSDLEVPIRGRTYREPDGAHSVVVRGRDLVPALQHVSSRSDCGLLAVVGLPEAIPDLAPMKDRKLIVVDADSGRLHDFAEAAVKVGADVEWIRSARPSSERLAASLLPVGAVVLAAGASARMGGEQKLLLDFDGMPMVRHAVEAASEGGCHQILVVYAADEVRDALDGHAELVFNPDARLGMSTSLRAGLSALRPDMEAALIMLGDQPLVGSRSVSSIVRAWRREGSRPAVAMAGSDKAKWTPPVILARELWPELESLEGDTGARHLLNEHPELLDIVPAQGRPDDIDTADDYAKIVRLFPRKRPTRRG